MKYFIKLDNIIWAVILLVVSVLSLRIRYTFMGEKFFLDSIKLLYIEQSGQFYSGGFDVAGKFFSYINFFNINSLVGWSLYITLIFYIINFFLVKNIKILRLDLFVFLILSIFLWYLFVAGITKEILQEIFFLVIYWTSVKNLFIRNDAMKVILGTFILLLSAFCFREYYIITAFFSIVVYFIFFLVKKYWIQKRSPTILVSVLIIISIMLFLLIARIVYPVEYEIIINLRDERYIYLVEGTDTFISNFINNNSNNLLIYIFNYCINLLRLLLPVELLWIGKIYYFPFLMYQLMFSFYYFRMIKNLSIVNGRQLISLVFISSFLIVAAFMEPDFGSWARHQCVIFPMVICCYIDDHKTIYKDNS